MNSEKKEVEARQAIYREIHGFESKAATESRVRLVINDRVTEGLALPLKARL